MKTSQLLATAFVVGSTTLPILTRAQVTLYTDRSHFLAATNNTINIDFSGLAATNSYKSYNSSHGVTLSGVKFVGNGPYGNILYVVDPGAAPAYYDWGSGAVMDAVAGGEIDVTLPAGITAVGSDIMSILPFADSFQVNLSTGDSFTVNSSSFPNRAFAGFTSTADISSLTFYTNGGSAPVIDNFVFGNNSAVPEPGTYAMLGALMLTVGGFLHRRQTVK